MFAIDQNKKWSAVRNKGSKLLLPCYIWPTTVVAGITLCVHLVWFKCILLKCWCLRSCMPFIQNYTLLPWLVALFRGQQHTGAGRRSQECWSGRIDPRECKSGSRGIAAVVERRAAAHVGDVADGGWLWGEGLGSLLILTPALNLCGVWTAKK